MVNDEKGKKKIKQLFPKDENFQISKQQFPLSNCP